ncbi:hypothetical protein Peur_043217 [Populus x canadensis]
MAVGILQVQLVNAKGLRDTDFFDLFASGVQNGTAELHPSKYRVVDASQSYVGEIQVGVTFTLKGTEIILFHRMLASVILWSSREKRGNDTTFDVISTIKV